MICLCWYLTHLCHLPPFYLVLCHCFKVMLLSSITSHRSGNEPALLHRKDGWTHELSIVNYHQSDHCLLKSNRQHKLNSLEQTSNGGCKGVVWCGVQSCFTAFYTKNSETFTKKTVGLEKLANDKYRYVFEIQPTISGVDHYYFPVCNDRCWQLTWKRWLSN